MKKTIFLVLSALLFLLLGCRTETLTDDSHPENSEHKNHLTSKRISLNEAKHKAKLVTEISKAKAEIEAKSKTDAKGKVINYGNGVSIDTDNVIYIENGPNYHTYTFNIIRDDAPADAPVENLLLTPLPDGSYREFLLTYHFTEQEKKALLAGIEIDRTGKVSVAELDKGTFGNPLAKQQSCNYETVDVYIPCGTGEHHSGNVGSWGGCKWSSQGFSAPQHYSLVALVCSSSPDDPGLPIIPGGGSSGGGGGSIDGGPPSEPTDPPCDIISPTSPQPGLTDGNGCPIGIPTQPILSKPFSLIVRNLTTINSDAEFYSGLENYYNANNQSAEAEAFIRWTDQFRSDNPNVTWTEFQNWFLTTSEGQDGEFITNLDDVLNSTQYQTKQMPTYSQFVSAFPKIDYAGYPGYYLKMPAAQVYPIIGGYLESLYNEKKDNGPFRNACAARWSLGMNGAGILIPKNEVSIRGADVSGQPRYYIVNSTAAGDFMQKTFGNPTHKLEGADANNATKVANFLVGKTGIYVVVNNSYEEAGYYGHIDLIQNSHVPGGANIHNVPGGIKSIRIWEFTP